MFEFLLTVVGSLRFVKVYIAVILPDSGFNFLFISLLWRPHNVSRLFRLLQITCKSWFIIHLDSCKLQNSRCQFILLLFVLNFCITNAIVLLNVSPYEDLFLNVKWGKFVSVAVLISVCCGIESLSFVGYGSCFFNSYLVGLILRNWFNL